MIDATHVSRRYPRGITALADVSLSVEKGEFVFLTGPSGAGKSTLLRLLLREDVPTGGTLRVGGRDLARLSPGEVQSYRRTVGFVFQDFRLVPRRTVLENVTLVLRAMGVDAPAQRRRALQVLQAVGLEQRLESFPPELSGGEQQRIAIARALINDPHLVLADEPTGNLDPDLAWEVMQLFREMNTRGTTVVVATHDRELIRRLGRRTIRLDRGQVAGA
ncbi:MAG: cell division ATP-binding protein FtsE [Vicinamibacteraceae bacterium]|nr:cell division ATP-binding protein FtsE [Vicinamibacteraceae bacterium]